MKALTFLISIGLMFAGQQAYAKACGKMVFVKGPVYMERGFRSPKKVRVGSKICSGDTVSSKEGGKGKLKMLDGNILTISPNSKFELQKYVYQPKKNQKQVEINLLYGLVRSKVNQKYKKKNQRFLIRTKSAVAGVRGTEFSSHFHKSDNRAEFVTFEGLVEVSELDRAGKVVRKSVVKPGHMVSVNGRSPSSPVRLPASDLLRRAKESDVSDKDRGALKKRKVPVFVDKDSAKSFDREEQQARQDQTRQVKEAEQANKYENERNNGAEQVVDLVPEQKEPARNQDGAGSTASATANDTPAKTAVSNDHHKKDDHSSAHNNNAKNNQSSKKEPARSTANNNTNTGKGGQSPPKDTGYKPPTVGSNTGVNTGSNSSRPPSGATSGGSQPKKDYSKNNNHNQNHNQTSSHKDSNKNRNTASQPSKKSPSAKQPTKQPVKQPVQQPTYFQNDPRIVGGAASNPYFRAINAGENTGAKLPHGAVGIGNDTSGSFRDALNPGAQGRK